MSDHPIDQALDALIKSMEDTAYKLEDQNRVPEALSLLQRTKEAFVRYKDLPSGSAFGIRFKAVSSSPVDQALQRLEQAVTAACVKYPDAEVATLIDVLTEKLNGTSTTPKTPKLRDDEAAIGATAKSYAANPVSSFFDDFLPGKRGKK